MQQKCCDPFIMASGLTIKYWGVRGSLPSAPTPNEWLQHIDGVFRNYFAAGFRDPQGVTQFLNSQPLNQIAGYGAATTSVEVKSNKTQLIIDGGSGIRHLSDNIMRGQTGRIKGPYHIFMTHFHWDHVIGLPFFTPHFVPGIHIHYYAVQKDLEKLIRGVFQKPYFPVSFEQLQSKIFFHVLEPRKPLKIDDITVTPYQLDHPDDCWGFRIESGGKSYSHCVDSECTRVTKEELGPDLPLYHNSDLMYFDAQYTLPELAEKANWGHSAAQVGLDIAFRESIKKVIFAHHDPGASIAQVQELKRQTQEYYNWRSLQAKNNGEQLFEVKWDFAFEGLEINL